MTWAYWWKMDILTGKGKTIWCLLCLNEIATLPKALIDWIEAINNWSPHNFLFMCHISNVYLYLSYQKWVVLLANELHFLTIICSPCSNCSTNLLLWLVIVMYYVLWGETALFVQSVHLLFLLGNNPRQASHRWINSFLMLFSFPLWFSFTAHHAWSLMSSYRIH